MKRNRIKTLEGIARILGAEGFKRYAKDYGNSRVNLDSDEVDAINTLDSYQNSETLIDHFNNFRETIEAEYATDYTPFYKTAQFCEQCEQERNEFGYSISI